MLEYISAHFLDEIDSLSIANSARIHPKYATSVFRKSTGMTLKRYVQLLRGDGCVPGIAMRSGLGSRSDFNRAFRKHMGKSPSGFRRSVATRLFLSGEPAFWRAGRAVQERGRVFSGS